MRAGDQVILDGVTEVSWANRDGLTYRTTADAVVGSLEIGEGITLLCDTRYFITVTAPVVIRSRGELRGVRGDS